MISCCVGKLKVLNLLIILCKSDSKIISSKSDAKAKTDEKKTSGRVPRATKPIVGKVKESGNNTESDNDTDGENVTGKDLSQPEPEEPPYDPDNPDPNVS